MYDHLYLKTDHLKGFDNYKYNAIDTNPLGVYVMHPFWNFTIKFIPRWIAPNLLTFVGFLFTVAASLLLSYYDYGFYASGKLYKGSSIPNWVFGVVSLFLFISYSLDGLDGKQARRTGTSGPLGELFDHGLDSWTTVFIPTALYSIFGRNDPTTIEPIRMYYICLMVFINFYLAHWEKYNTGVLYLPWSYDCSMVGLVLFFALTAIVGPERWKMTVIKQYSFGQITEILFYITTFISNVPVSIYNIYVCYRDKTGKNLSLYEGSRPLIPLTVFVSLCLIWIKYSSTNILERDPRMFFMMSGAVFSNISCRLIVAQMSKTRCDGHNILLTFLGFAVVLSIYLPSIELLVMYLMTLLSILAHIHYGTCVVKQMADHFNIQCFKIPCNKK
ncbi:ethanolaminephosphotransferase 1 [Daktulosphaira vitifoliae]|uniref:ethanolaminephosphotransferase 1 n=1 Tax=Daktulosphaira vitifoliae TaxID=58002 RepID=UPI0021AA8FCF|nr:ethanolaminephosphotransferase 1 [Daktulosphaira vitifoliae]